MDYSSLIEAAYSMLPKAYAPYSHFHVGAALLCSDGSIVTGMNIENASYSATICAERSAVCNAISEGKKSFEAIVICGGSHGKVTEYCPPCGVCRQVLREFVNPKEFKVILAKSTEDYVIYTLEELLPLSFGPENLE